MVHILTMLGGLALAQGTGEQDPGQSDDVVAPSEDAASVVTVPERQPRVGLGLGHGGGGVLGLHFNVYLAHQITIDLGAHWRQAVTNSSSYSATALTLGVNKEHGWKGARPGYFAKVGSSGGDGGYREDFVAAGFHLGLWTPNQRHVFTAELGPGLFLRREIPNYNPGPPLLWMFRLSWHLNLGDRT